MSYQSSIRNKKNNKNFNREKQMKYELNEEIEEYGYISKMLGNCRCLVISNSNFDCIGTICGSLRKFNKRILIEKGDINIFNFKLILATIATILAPTARILLFPSIKEAIKIMLSYYNRGV